MEIAIDTSTSYAGIALSNKGVLISEITWHAVQNHTTRLVPNIDSLLKSSGLSADQVNAVFVAIGPGSFNGLRVGVSTAKAMSFALNVPIIGINTMEIEAFPFLYMGLPVCPIHTAGREEIATAIFQQIDEIKCILDLQLTTIEALCVKITDRTIFCGEITEEMTNDLKAILGNNALIPEQSIRVRRAAFLARLGWQRLQSGQTDDNAKLQPVYMRPPPITQRKVK